MQKDVYGYAMLKISLSGVEPSSVSRGRVTTRSDTISPLQGYYPIYVRLPAASSLEPSPHET